LSREAAVTAIGKTPRISSLPVGMVPRGLSREQSADYYGVSPTKFDEMVADGRAPKPTKIDGRRVWDIRKLDRAFDALDGDDDPNDPWGRQRE
jgi:hypothetical protein